MTAREEKGVEDSAGNLPPGSQAPIMGPAGGVPLTTAAALGRTVGPSMSAQERETAGGLEQLDTQLAGLYRLGLELAPRVAEPGVAYLIAHAGRELGRGVVRLLSGVVPALTGQEIERVSQDEKYRAEIARMLGVTPGHPSVTIWFRTQLTIVSAVHYRLPAPAPDALADAFRQLSGLLFGRVAPYFSTHAELNALLGVSEPTPQQLTRVGELLLRPVQRHHFFGKLEHPAWLPLLAEAGYFTAPDLSLQPDGTRLARPWPEGEFLVRTARHDPERVVQLLLAISRANQNPVVWDVTARAALALPVPQARRLVRRLTRAASTLPTGGALTHHLIDFTRALAEAGEPRAFDLAKFLLWLAPGPAPTEMLEAPLPRDLENGNESGADRSAPQHARLARSIRRGGNDTEWMLERLDAYGLSQFIQKALPPLEALDAGSLLGLLVRKLALAVHLGRLAEQGKSSPSTIDAERGAVLSANVDAAATSGDDERDHSEFWADDLNRAGEGGDVRSQLAAALAGVARRMATHASSEARLVDQTLARERSDVFARIRFIALRAAEQFAPPSSLDSLIGGTVVVDPPFGAREVAPFLRVQFERASPDAQRQFLEALELGPAAEFVDRMVDYQQGRAGDNEGSRTSAESPGATEGTRHLLREAEAIGVIADWQRRRLRWFHDRIPKLLVPLASALEVVPSIPSARNQALDEVGRWGGSVWNSGDRSPVSVGELRAMSPEGVVEYLRSWRPDDAVSRFERPTPDGLEKALTSFVSENVESGEALARLLRGTAVAPGYLEAVLEGFEALTDNGQWLPWQAVVELLEFVLSEAERDLAAGTNPSAETFQWRRAAQRAVDLLRKVCANDRVPEGAGQDVWRVAGAIIRSPITWGEIQNSARPLRFGAERREEVLGDLLFSALNSLPGHAVRMLVEAALWDYRRVNPTNGPAVANEGATAEGLFPGDLRDPTGIASRILPLLDWILKETGRSGLFALTMLGDFIPQLLLVARHWVLDHAEVLFDGGAASPRTHPTWGAYVARCSFYELVFRDLRPWYVRAADAAPDPTPGSEGSDWSVSRNLAKHMVVAIVRGAAALGDNDQLVERVFARVRVEDRVHAYWSLFRGLSDADGPVPEKFVRRLVEFWEWRVSVLESQPESKERADEADGLGWLLVTPCSPSAAAIRLGLRTLRLASDSWRAGGSGWERLAELAEHDAVGTFELVELLARAALASDYPFLPFPQVSPSLRSALSANSASIRTRARRLINDLGERGLLEFGELLSEVGPEPLTT